jgi:hypothetical protein
MTGWREDVEKERRELRDSDDHVDMGLVLLEASALREGTVRRSDPFCDAEECRAMDAALTLVRIARDIMDEASAVDDVPRGFGLDVFVAFKKLDEAYGLLADYRGDG